MVLLVLHVWDCEMKMYLCGLQPFMERKLKIQDTCGIHNLHAMPGVIGGIVGAITAAAASKEVYGEEG